MSSKRREMGFIFLVTLLLSAQGATSQKWPIQEVSAFVPHFSWFGKGSRQKILSTSKRRGSNLSMMLPTTYHGRQSPHQKHHHGHCRQPQEQMKSSGTRLFGVVDNIKRYLFPEEETEDASICIIGGGVSGLAAAITAMEESSGRGGSGKRVKTVLVEMDDKVGGRVRSDTTEEGFVLDRGFAVFIEEYPEAKRLLNYTALGLRPFQPGALVVKQGGALERVADPLRRPWDVFVALAASVGTLEDKLRVLAVLGTVFTKSSAELFREPETDTLTCLRERYGFSQQIISEFFQPFLEGIYLAPLEQQSSRMFHFVFQMFSKGSASLPTGGIGAVAKQLATKATDLGVDIRCGSSVELVQVLHDDRTLDATRCRFLVTLSNGERIRSSSVILATEGPQANFLLGCLGKGWEELLLANEDNTPQPQEQREVGCLYYVLDSPAPVQDPILVLNGEAEKRGTVEHPINNLCFPSVVNPSYAPPGSNQTLASITVLKKVMDAYVGREKELDTAVRRQLSGWNFPGVDSWKLLGVYGITYAQPAQFGGAYPANVYGGRNCSTYLNRTLPDGLYVCGDFMATATLNGALTSGCNAGKMAAGVAELVELIKDGVSATSSKTSTAKTAPASSSAMAADKDATSTTPPTSSSKETVAGGADAISATTVTADTEFAGKKTLEGTAAKVETPSTATSTYSGDVTSRSESASSQLTSTPAGTLDKPKSDADSDNGSKSSGSVVTVSAPSTASTKESVTKTSLSAEGVAAAKDTKTGSGVDSSDKSFASPTTTATASPKTTFDSAATATSTAATTTTPSTDAKISVQKSSSDETPSIGGAQTVKVGITASSSAVDSGTATTKGTDVGTTKTADGDSKTATTSQEEGKSAGATADYLKRLSSSYYDLPLKPKPEASKAISVDQKSKAPISTAAAADDDDKEKAPANTSDAIDTSSPDVRKKAEGMWLIQAMKFVLAQGRRRRGKGDGDTKDSDDDNDDDSLADFDIPRLEEVGSIKSTTTPTISKPGATSGSSSGAGKTSTTSTATSATTTESQSSMKRKQKKESKKKTRGKKKKTVSPPPPPPLMVYPAGPYDYDDE